MCNATISLEMAIRALGLTGEVIVPSFTFVATAHSLQWQEITPLFCDIDPITHNLDPAQVEKMITPRTSGITGVHTWERPCDIGALEEIARQIWRAGKQHLTQRRRVREGRRVKLRRTPRV
jgi:dTDP-4-amino-4,6-dideoxygalactose transaminase